VRPNPFLVFGLLAVSIAGGAVLPLRASKPPVMRPTAVVEGPPTVVLLTVDTLRPDFLGGESSDAPAIAELFDDSQVFTRARSAAPWTKPAMATILTGLSPAVHGVTNRRARLADEIETLAERMQAVGYRTLGLGLNAHLEPLFEFSQGFDRYAFPARADWGVSIGAQVLERFDPHHFPRGFPSTQAIGDVAVDWIRQSVGEPMFLWMHVLDPHWPYEPPAEWTDVPAHPRFGHSWGDPETVTDVQAGNTKLGPDDREFVRELYRGEVRYADANVGRVIAELKRLGLYETALIVFASDHGEEFWEHGTFEHGHTLYDEVLRVPLAFKLPGEGGGMFDVPVSTESVTPTILDVAGLAYDPDKFQAESLAPHWRMSNLDDQPLFSTGTYYFAEKQAVVFDG